MLLLLTVLFGCGEVKEPPSALMVEMPAAPVGPPPLPPGWARVSPDMSWFDRQPRWSEGLRAVMPPDDPHRKIRLRVGCKDLRQPISVGLANLPFRAKGAKFRVETLGVEYVHEFRASGQEEVIFPDSMTILTTLRSPGVKQVSIMSNAFTYGLIFDLDTLERIIQTSAVEACSWELEPRGR